MSFIVVAGIAAAGTAGAIGAQKLLGGGGGGGSVGFAEVPETEEAKAARKRLFELATGPKPVIPLRGIAELPPQTEERQLARTTAKELVQPQDFLSLPEVQGIISETKAQGDLLVNRLGRMLQSAGALTSTPGRDILGRAVSDIQKSLAAQLSPFAAEERRRRADLIPVLESLGLTEEERARGVSQAKLDALFSKLSTEAELPLTFEAELLKAVLGSQPGVQPFIKGQPSGGLGGAEDIIASILSASLRPKPAGVNIPLQNQSPSGPAGFGSSGFALA